MSPRKSRQVVAYAWSSKVSSDSSEEESLLSDGLSQTKGSVSSESLGVSFLCWRSAAASAVTQN